MDRHGGLPLRVWSGGLVDWKDQDERRPAPTGVVGRDESRMGVINLVPTMVAGAGWNRDYGFKEKKGMMNLAPTDGGGPTGNWQNVR